MGRELDIRDRRGKLQIHNEFLTNELIPKLAEIFAILEFVPTRAESLWHVNVIEYIGISPKFKMVAPEYITPEYYLDISTKTSEDGEVIITDVIVKEYKWDKDNVFGNIGKTVWQD